MRMTGDRLDNAHVPRAAEGARTGRDRNEPDRDEAGPIILCGDVVYEFHPAGFDCFADVSSATALAMRAGMAPQVIDRLCRIPQHGCSS